MSYDVNGTFTWPSGLTWANGQYAYAQAYDTFLAELQAAINRAQLKDQTIKRKSWLNFNTLYKPINIKVADSAYEALRYDQIFPAMAGMGLFMATEYRTTEAIVAPTFQFRTDDNGWLFDVQVAHNQVVTGFSSGTFQGPAIIRLEPFGIQNVSWGSGGNAYYKGSNQAVTPENKNGVYCVWKRADGNWHVCPLEPTGAFLTTEDSFILTTEDGSMLITEN